MEYLNVIVIVAAGLMVGSELAIAAFVHPTLDRLPDNVHLPAASALARVLGRFMPFWYILVLSLTLAEVYIQWRQSGRLPVWIVTSAILLALAIVYSIAALVPINNRIASWGKVTPPADWKTFRHRWDLLHRWRVLLLTVAFAFLIV
jgi:Anthrone oxygenase